MNARKTLVLLTVGATLVLQSRAQTYDTNNVVVQTFAGSGFSGYVDGIGQQTMFNNPKGVVGDSLSNLFVLDTGNLRIRKITPDGTVSTFAGGDPGGFLGAIASAQSMAIDHSDTLWIPTFQYGNLVRVGSDGNASGIFWNGLGIPWGACVDSGNNIYISDYNHQVIWRRTTNSAVEVFAGSGNTGSIDGNGIFTSFNAPAALTADAADNIYVWDSGNRKIRRINQNRDVVTLTGGSSTSGDGQNPSFSSISACAWTVREI
jgi:mucin-19